MIGMLKKATLSEELTSTEKILFYVFTFLAWMLFSSVVIALTQLLKSLPFPLPGHQSVGETLKDLSNVRTWKLVGLPVMVGAGILGTFLQIVIMKLNRNPPK